MGALRGPRPIRQSLRDLTHDLGEAVAYLFDIVLVTDWDITDDGFARIQ